MAAAKEGGCPTADTSTPPSRSEPAAPPCGQIGITPSVSSVRMEGNRLPVSELVRSSQWRWSKTNLPGTFDIRLQFSDQAGGAPPSHSTGPPVFTALQAQLGLKLQSVKTAVEFLVIHRIERPTAT